MDRAINGFFRPNLFVRIPNEMLPIKLPMAHNDAIHEPSSIVILPDGNGDFSDVNRNIVGLAHPQMIPKPSEINDTVKYSNIQLISCEFVFKLYEKKPVNAAKY